MYIPQEHSCLSFNSMKLKFSADGKTLESLIFHGRANPPLRKLIRVLKDQGKLKDQKLTEHSVVLYHNLTSAFWDIVSFRSQFEQLIRPKPVHKNLKNKNITFSKIADPQNNLVVQKYVNDTIYRLEKLIGHPLIYDLVNGFIALKQGYTKVVDLLPNNTPIVVWYHPNSLGETYLFEGYHWAIGTGIHVYDTNNKPTTLPRILVKTISSCPTCQRNFVKNYKFVYHPHQDEQLCSECIKVYNKYKQPDKWNPDNIFHDGYHTNRSGFKFIVCKKDFENNLPIGLELETEFNVPKYGDKGTILTTFWNLLGKKDIVFERDSSLNEYGVECITNPMGLNYAKDYWKNAWDFLKEETLGIYSGVPNHTRASIKLAWGAHMTFAKKNWTNMALAKFLNFMYDPDNKALLRAIAQRTLNYGGNFIGEKQYSNTKKQFRVNKGNSVSSEKIWSEGRNTTVNLTKKGLVEVRMFQAVNTKIELLKNYEFLTGMWEWLHEYNNGMFPKQHEFLAWLRSGPKNKTRKYIDLIIYLQQKDFTIRDNQNGNILLEKNIFQKDMLKVVLPSTKDKY